MARLNLNPLGRLRANVTTRHLFPDHFYLQLHPPKTKSVTYTESYPRGIAIGIQATIQTSLAVRSSKGKMTMNRYPALMSIFGVVGGTYLAFVLLSPNKDGSVVSDEDRRNVRGGADGTSPFGTRSARAPRSTAGTDYEGRG